MNPQRRVELATAYLVTVLAIVTPVLCVIVIYGMMNGGK